MLACQFRHPDFIAVLTPCLLSSKAKKALRLKLLILLASPTGFEPVTPRLGIWCSILLSYEDVADH